MQLNDITLFCSDPDKGPKVHIKIDRADSLWPVTLKINPSKDQEYASPRVVFFMTHNQLIEMIESFQNAFDSYIVEKEGIGYGD